MSSRPLDIDIQDTPYDPRASERVVQYREVNGTRLYRVYIRLVGSDVPFVRSAEYRLHETFRPQVQLVTRTPDNPDCMLDIWTWGVFEVRAVVSMISAGQSELFHELTYDRYFKDEAWKKNQLRLLQA